MAQENTRTQNTRTGTRTTPTTQMRQLGATVRLCSMLRRVYSSTGTPQRSHPCIERYSHSRRVCIAALSADVLDCRTGHLACCHVCAIASPGASPVQRFRP